MSINFPTWKGSGTVLRAAKRFKATREADPSAIGPTLWGQRSQNGSDFLRSTEPRRKKKTCWHSIESWLFKNGILISWLIIIPIYLGSSSSPISNNQPRFFSLLNSILAGCKFQMVFYLTTRCYIWTSKETQMFRVLNASRSGARFSSTHLNSKASEVPCLPTPRKKLRRPIGCSLYKSFFLITRAMLLYHTLPA